MEVDALSSVADITGSVCGVGAAAEGRGDATGSVCAVDAAAEIGVDTAAMDGEEATLLEA